MTMPNLVELGLRTLVARGGVAKNVEFVSMTLFSMRRYATAVYAVVVCLCGCVSVSVAL